MWIVENEARTRPCDKFYYRLVLKPEMGSNFSWTGPPPWERWIGRPCWTSSSPWLVCDEVVMSSSLTCLIVVARRERYESWLTQRWQLLGAYRRPLRLHIGPDYTRKRHLSWLKIRVRKASSVPTSLWDGKASSRPLITMCMECDIGLILCNGLKLWNGLDL